ncbi:Fur family transcriptional regulator [Clostridium sp. ATCC 25772]|uniref:Fur family transcriptional regulator n=1 Tax=Clostridium sp. ATCC 25772 TaxID=1676991 RepID=UPI000782A703|nr:Fur family transcriptional regulator [Clostridium sp. ATCC 25772]
MLNFTQIFKEKKLKLTPQRIAVYKYLCSTTEHPSAETIYKALQEDYPTMSLATVYKALKVLVSVNLVQELNVGEGNFRYDASVCPHPHIQCIKCSRVDDVNGISFVHLNDDIKDYTDYEVLLNQVYFYGLCSECKNSAQLEEKNETK